MIIEHTTQTVPSVVKKYTTSITTSASSTAASTITEPSFSIFSTTLPSEDVVSSTTTMEALSTDGKKVDVTSATEVDVTSATEVLSTMIPETTTMIQLTDVPKALSTKGSEFSTNATRSQVTLTEPTTTEMTPFSNDVARAESIEALDEVYNSNIKHCYKKVIIVDLHNLKKSLFFLLTKKSAMAKIN